MAGKNQGRGKSQFKGQKRTEKQKKVSKPTVANHNVNKLGTEEKRTEKVQNIDDSRKRRGKSSQETAKDNKKRKENSTENSKSRSKNLEAAESNANETEETTAIDAENCLEISVSKGNESYCQSDYGEEGEIEERNDEVFESLAREVRDKQDKNYERSRSKSRSVECDYGRRKSGRPDQMDFEDNQRMNEGSRSRSRSKELGKNSTRKTQSDTEKEIEKIDRELSHRLKEIQKLMSGRKDLKKSNEALAQCIDTDRQNKQNQQRKSRSRSGSQSRQGSEARSYDGTCRSRSQGCRYISRSPRWSSQGKTFVNCNRNAIVGFGERASNSEITIYKDAVEKRTSSSSEDLVDTSDDLIDCQKAIRNTRFFAESERNTSGEDNFDEEPGPSGYRDLRSRSRSDSYENRRRSRSRSPRMSAEEKAERMIREAEEAKTKLFALTGKINRSDYKFTAEIDEDYSVIGGHVDGNLQQKIIKGEYVDFGRLIPRDRLINEDESDRYELTMRNGKTF